MGGKTVWTHVSSTEDLTYLCIHEKRGKIGMDAAGVLPSYHGTAIHDCYASYNKYVDMRHGLCGAHLLRELEDVVVNGKQEWAQEMKDLLLEMNKTKDELISQEIYEAPNEVWSTYCKKYDDIVKKAQAQNPVPEKIPNKRGRPKKGKVGALVHRLELRKDQWLLFFTDFSVPFTNNQAERDIRHLKVKGKVSGCFRTWEGAREFADILSYIGTVRKQNQSEFIELRNAILGRPFYVITRATD